MKHPPFLFLLGLLAAGAARAETFKAAFDETHPFDPHGEIRLSNVNGSVSIRTWDHAEVRIEGEKRASNADDLAALTVSIDASADTLVVKTKFLRSRASWFGWLFGRWGNEEVHFTLTVPAGVRLNGIDTVNARIAIDGIRGAVKASTVNGEIRATGLGDDVSLSTVNGPVRAEFAALGAQGRLKFRTVNGAVTVTLPKTTGATVAASTVNGGISCDFPLQGTRAGGHHLNGTIGDGTASLTASTVNGGIHLKSL